ncbi:hypothetical protein TNCV_1164271 [Trichonephila clavipes]|nr:hypothetical protein TNCV_1164271 [Trichonephila clavipes]
MDINFCVRLGKSASDIYKKLNGCNAGRYYHERKLLSDNDVSEKAGKVPKTTNALDFRRLPAPLKTSKKFLRRHQTTAESVGISSVTCQRILTKDLNMHRLSQHIVPRMLNEDQSANEVKSASQVELKNMAKNGF